MALKSKIDKATFDALKPEIKAEYKAEGDDYILDIDELDSHPGLITMKEALSRAKTNEVTAHNRTKQLLADATTRVTELEEGDKTRTNDTKAIEDRYKKQIETIKKEGDEKAAKLETQLRSVLVDAEAEKLANEISTAPSLMKPVIKERLRADLSGDTPVTVVLGADGQPSSAKIADLKKELLANKEYGPILTGSKASGSGASKSNGGGSATSYKGKEFADLSEAERTEWAKEDEAGFTAASNAHKNKVRYGT